MVNSAVGFNINRLNGGEYNNFSRKSTLSLVRTNEAHLMGTGDAERNALSNVGGESFSDLLVSQLDKTSQLESKAESLTTQFLIDPDSVNEHDVTIASTEATLAVNILTNVVSRALDSYRTIISL